MLDLAFFSQKPSVSHESHIKPYSVTVESKFPCVTLWRIASSYQITALFKALLDPCHCTYQKEEKKTSIILSIFLGYELRHQNVENSHC